MKKLSTYYLNIGLFLIILLFASFIVYFLFKSKKLEPMTMDNITVVSGYWQVKNKYKNDKYNDWFKNTLKINQRYIFFCEKENNDYIKSFRDGVDTVFIDYPISSFYTNQFSTNKWIDETHVPSKELGMIWNEKVHMLKLAKDMDKTSTDFYIWIDSGIAPYRETAPPTVRLNLKDVDSLPKDKLCYSRVEENYHNISAGCLLIHRNIIDEFHDKYYKLLSECDDGWKCGSDQYIFTKMMNKYPELFYKLSDGYGGNLLKLYEKYI
jgi:hypothetical protein